MKTLQGFIEKVERAPRLDFGDTIGKSFDLFGNIWTQGLLLQGILIAVNYGITIITYLPLMGSAFILEGSDSPEGIQEMILGILTVLFMLVLYIIYAVFAFALQAAFFNIIRMKDRGLRNQEGVNFGMFIKKKHIKKVFVLTMCQIGIAILAVLLFIIPIFYVIIPLQFATIIFAFNPDWTVNDIYKAAFKLGTAKWGISFASVLVGGFIAMLGVIACFIGVLATASFAILPGYLIYKGVIGFTEDDDMIAQIGA